MAQPLLRDTGIPHRAPFTSIPSGMVALAILVFLAFPGAGVGAQELPSISGTVTGPDGGAVAAAEVELLRADTELRTLRITDGEGRYTFADLAVGVPYTVTVRATG